jgi:hypothetical protein
MKETEKIEIVYCNLIVDNKGKKEELKEVVHSLNDNIYKGKKILSIDVIKSLGFKNESKGFDLGVKSEEKRNLITGAYE